MPFAGFDDWDSCIRTMTDEEGHDQDAAERICGALQAEAKADNGDVDELRESLSRARGLIADVGVDLNSAVDRPAINSKWTMFKSVDEGGPSGSDTQIDAPLVMKQDDDLDGREEKRIAYAPAMIPREVDKEGDVVGTATVEQAAHDYLKQDGGVDADHDLIDGKGDPVESWILPEAKEWDLPDGGTETYPAGTWMVGIEWDKETWKRIQDGDLEGLSIYGKADHVPLEKSADETAKQFVVPFADESVVQVLYASRDVAAKAAERMGFEGDEDELTHAHEFEGEQHWMPGPDHDAYVDAYNDFAEAEGFGPVGGDGEMVEAAATEKADEDPCWEGYTMVGTDENGDPRCVPDDEVPDAEGFESAVSMDGSGPPDGATPKNDGGATIEQNSHMSDSDIADRVDKVESEVSEVNEAVEAIKDAVDTDKQPGDASGVLRDLAAELANRDEIAANTDEIMSELKSSFLSDKENDGMGDGGDMDDGEDDEEDMESSASKSADDGDPNFGKATDGSESAAVAKENSGGEAGLPSYSAALEEDA